MRGQISAEMLIVLVIVIGIALIVASQLLQTAGSASKKIDQKTGELFDATDSASGISGGSEGDYCDENLPCQESLSCSDGICN